MCYFVTSLLLSLWNLTEIHSCGRVSREVCCLGSVQDAVHSLWARGWATLWGRGWGGAGHLWLHGCRCICIRGRAGHLWLYGCVLALVVCCLHCLFVHRVLVYQRSRWHIDIWGCRRGRTGWRSGWWIPPRCFLLLLQALPPVSCQWMQCLSSSGASWI